ncbi:hypothetical protein ABPG72_017099, partial [Tetrahymena utriculariae]
ILLKDGLKNVWITILCVSNNISLIYYIACLGNRDFSKGGLFFLYMCVPIINTFYSLIMFCLNKINNLKKDFASFQNCRNITVKQALLLVKCILSNIIWAMINAFLIELRLIELILQFLIYSKHSITINRDLEKYLLDNNLGGSKYDLNERNAYKQNIDTDFVQLDICETENQCLPTQQDQRLYTMQDRKMKFNQNQQPQDIYIQNKQEKQSANSILVTKQVGISSINRGLNYYNKQKQESIDIQSAQNRLTEEIIFYQSQQYSLKDIFKNQIFKLSFQKLGKQDSSSMLDVASTILNSFQNLKECTIIIEDLLLSDYQIELFRFSKTQSSLESILISFKNYFQYLDLNKDQYEKILDDLNPDILFNQHLTKSLKYLNEINYFMQEIPINFLDIKLNKSYLSEQEQIQMTAILETRPLKNGKLSLYVQNQSTFSSFLNTLKKFKQYNFFLLLNNDQLKVLSSSLKNCVQLEELDFQFKYRFLKKQQNQFKLFSKHSNNNLKEKYFLRTFSQSISKLFLLKSLSLEFKDCHISQQEAIPFFINLKDFKSLKHLNLNLKNNEIDKQVFSEFQWCIAINQSSKLQSSRFLGNFLSNQNLTTLNLNLDNVELRSQGLQMISQGIMQQFNLLELVLSIRVKAKKSKQQIISKRQLSDIKREEILKIKQIERNQRLKIMRDTNQLMENVNLSIIKNIEKIENKSKQNTLNFINNYLEESLNNNQIQNNNIISEGLIQAFYSFDNMPQIKMLVLNFGQNFIQSDGFYKLAESLEFLSQLEELKMDFNCNQIDDFGLVCFSNMIKRFSKQLTLFHLNLESNKIESLLSIDYFSKKFLKHQRVQDFKLVVLDNPICLTEKSLSNNDNQNIKIDSKQSNTKEIPISLQNKQQEFRNIQRINELYPYSFQIEFQYFNK